MRHLSTLCRFPNAIGFDMGGTSTDVSLVYNGEERVTNEWYVEYGYPIRFPSIEVLTIARNRIAENATVLHRHDPTREIEWRRTRLSELARRFISSGHLATNSIGPV